MKNISVGEVYTFKLASGEEVIAKVVAVGEGSISLSHPLSVAPNPQGMGLIPAIFTADHDGNIELNTNTVTMWAASADQIRIKYIEATTGITTQSKKIVLG